MMLANWRYFRFIKFALSAGIYNLAAYAIYSILIYLQIHYLIASSSAFVAGVILSYFLNKKLVFAVTTRSRQLLLRYLFFYLLLLIFNLGLLHLFVSWLKINPYLAQIGVTCIAAFISYNTMRIAVFRKT
jgi:putative flippase GtrA